MRLSPKSRRRLFRAVRNSVVCIDTLENRRLMDGETVQTAIAPVLANTTTPSSNAITLNQHFNDTTLPGTLATFNTSYGTIQVALTDAATPQTVANFLSYVNSGAYNGTIFHRSVDINTGQGATPTAPGTIIQGGGYSLTNNSINHIPTNGTVPDEYTHELYGNVAGTLVMAKTALANSATSEWYFNVTDNTVLDPPTTDQNGVQTSYTVFGRIIPDSNNQTGQQVVNAIAALPTYALSSDLSTVPVTGITEAEAQAGVSINANNLVYTNSITAVPGTDYTVTSDNKALVTPTVTNGVLSLAYGAGLSGVADITVTAKNLDGTSASTTFAVTVPNAATPTAGPVAAPFTAPFVVTGNSGTFSVLGPDTDSLAALDPSTIAIVTQPVNGTATVDSATGFIHYTPNAGFTGNDTLTYTVTDTLGNVSAPGTVTLDAVPTAVKLNVSAGTTLVFKQPDGVIGHLTVAGATAIVTFTDFQVTTKRVGHTIIASGAGTDITDITIENRVQFPRLSVTSTGPMTIGTINDVNSMSKVYVPNTTLTGNMSIGSVNYFTAAALNGALLNLGTLPNGVFTNLTIKNVTNSDINAAGNLGLVKSNKWTISDGLKHTITAQFINDLEVPGTFDEDLNLYYNRFGMANARVGDPTGAWNMNGNLVKATLGTPGSNWTLSVASVIQNLTFSGNLSNQVTAAAINKLTVKGLTDNAVIQTNGNFGNFFLIGRLTFVGAVTNSVVFSTGHIGAITAPSMFKSRIYAGVKISLAQSGAIATTTSDFSNDAFIESIVLGHGKTTSFSDCLISAETIGVLRLGRASTANGGTPEGLSAHSIRSISATLVPGGNLRAGPAQLKTAATLAAYETKAKLALGDLAINLI